MSPGISFLVGVWFAILIGFISPCYGTELKCTEQPDGTIACSFLVEPSRDSPPATLSLSKSCVSKQQNSDSQLCVSGTVEITWESTRNEPPPAGTSGQRVVVNMATYSPPYSQHGTSVEDLLQNAPSSKEASKEWAEWCLDLASAHHIAASQDGSVSRNDNVWEQLELAINAYKEAIRTIKEVIQRTTASPSTDHEIFLARAQYFLGEAYFLDPSLKYINQAIEAYRESHRLYAQVLQTVPPENRPAMETKFAEACTKFGMALMSNLDPMETAPSWMTAMMMMDTPFGQFINNNRKKKTTTDSLSEIQEYFQAAIHIYEQYHNAPTLSEVDHEELQFSFATTLQQAAALAITQGQLVDAKQKYLRVLDLLWPTVSRLSPSSMDAPSSHSAIADTLLSLTDTCVQLGDYDCAKKTYRQAMEFHETHKVEVAPMMPLQGDGDDDMTEWNRGIAETMEALKEYRTHTDGGKGRYWRSFSDPLNMGGSGGEYMYEKDNGYEGDLLASLGTMYLSIGDPRAITYLEQAKEKYTLSQEDKSSPVMADLLMNLSMGYYRNYQFHDSQRVHGQALDIYRRLYGDGVNPYMQMMMPPNMADGFHSHHSHWHHGGSFSRSSWFNSGSKDYDEEVQSEGGPNSPPSEILIDLELLKQSIQNHTDEPSPHDLTSDEL